MKLTKKVEVLSSQQTEIREDDAEGIEVLKDFFSDLLATVDDSAKLKVLADNNIRVVEKIFSVNSVDNLVKKVSEKLSENVTNLKDDSKTALEKAKAYYEASNAKRSKP